jgi:predicted DNA-binding transcriptional regulator YafY
MPHIKNALLRYRIIDKCLRNKYRPFPTKRDLREDCEEALFGSHVGENICDSTIEKDMFAMRMEHDAPIKYNKREGGYYYENPEFSIDQIPLTEDDLSSIKFAVQTLMQFREASIFKQFGSAIDKIVDRVTITSNPMDQELNDYVQFEMALSSSGNEFLAPLLEAIRNALITRFDYTGFVNGITKKRNVIPLLLKEYRNRWYLISHDLDKEKIITYALERMTELEITKQKVEKPSDFNPDLFFKHAVGITSNEGNPEKVVFLADNVAARYIESQPFHNSQTILNKNKDSTTFQLDILVSEEFIRSILSYGGEIEMLEPQSLKNEVKRRITVHVQKYDLKK